MPRAAARPRREVTSRTLRLARLAGFRHDPVRGAYVLRGIGNRFGPVLRDRAAGPRLPLDNRSGVERRKRSVAVARDRRLADRRRVFS